MKNLLHSSLVVASIVASQSAPAALRQENDHAFAKGQSKIEKQLDDLLYGDEVMAEPRKSYRDNDLHTTKKSRKFGKGRPREEMRG